MPRKKKEKVEVNNDTNEFVYCGWMKCPHTNCLRHHIYEPWGEIILERKFNPDREWNCKDIVED